MIYDLNVVFCEELRYGSSVQVARTTCFLRKAGGRDIPPPFLRPPKCEPWLADRRLGAVNPRS